MKWTRSGDISDRLKDRAGLEQTNMSCLARGERDLIDNVD